MRHEPRLAPSRSTGTGSSAALGLPRSPAPGQRTGPPPATPTKRPLARGYLAGCPSPRCGCALPPHRGGLPVWVPGPGSSQSRSPPLPFPNPGLHQKLPHSLWSDRATTPVRLRDRPGEAGPIVAGNCPGWPRLGIGPGPMRDQFGLLRLKAWSSFFASSSASNSSKVCRYPEASAIGSVRCNLERTCSTSAMTRTSWRRAL